MCNKTWCFAKLEESYIASTHSFVLKNCLRNRDIRDISHPVITRTTGARYSIKTKQNQYVSKKTKHFVSNGNVKTESFAINLRQIRTVASHLGRRRLPAGRYIRNVVRAPMSRENVRPGSFT